MLVFALRAWERHEIQDGQSSGRDSNRAPPVAASPDAWSIIWSQNSQVGDEKQWKEHDYEDDDEERRENDTYCNDDRR
jgi:hypothetical protein